MKRILFLSLIAAGLLAATLFVSSPRSKAMPTGCTATGFFRDNINMTAAVINPTGPVTGTIDATGCNIGVYYDDLGAGGTINDAEIFGANYFGVVNRQANVTITESNIHDIGNTPFDGTQHGVAVYYANLTFDSNCDQTGTTTGTIDGNTISSYQKGGIT